MRNAYRVMQGIGFARGGQLPFKLFDSVAMSEDEADAMAMDENVQRAIDEAMSEAAAGR